MRKECTNVRESVKNKITECTENMLESLNEQIQNSLREVDSFDCTKVLRFKDEISQIQSFPKKKKSKKLVVKMKNKSAV